MGLLKAAIYLGIAYAISEIFMGTIYSIRQLPLYEYLPKTIRDYIQLKSTNRETVMFYLLVIMLILF